MTARTDIKGSVQTQIVLVVKRETVLVGMEQDNHKRPPITHMVWRSRSGILDSWRLLFHAMRSRADIARVRPQH